MADTRTFRLGGEEFTISKQQVERTMEDLIPTPIGKYRVRVNGVDYPPKQVISETLRKELASFTTMDATRILSALGFEIESASEKRQPARNKSEILFEQYLSMSWLLEISF